MGNTGYKVNPNILFWIRLKTLTINNDINRILEVAYVYTDIQLTTCQMGSHLVLKCTKEQFLKADHNQLKLAKANGLYDACLNSTLELDQAEHLIMKDIEFRNLARGQLLAAGKQAHLAKYALMRHMPKLYDFLHYRIFDLSSVQLVVERFRENTVNKGQSQNEQNQKENEETMVGQNEETAKEKGEERKIQGILGLGEMLMGGKRANEEVWQDIHQMQFYCQHALNDQ